MCVEIDSRKMLFDRKEEIEMWEKFPYWKNVHGFKKTQYFNNLFRVEAIEDFKSNIKNNRLYFSHPKKWLNNDKLDSILLRLNVILPDGKKVFQGYFNETFCQCWSTEDSKKMWEEYAQEERKAYVKMVVNLDSLMRAFDTTTKFKGYSSLFWAGLVTYSNFDESYLPISLNSEDKLRLFLDQELISKLYLEKRSSFDFENEVRFINFCRKDRTGCDFAFVELQKPLNQILEGIIIDSRLKNYDDRQEIISFAEDQGINIIENKILWD